MTKQVCRVGDLVAGTCNYPDSNHPITFSDGHWNPPGDSHVVDFTTGNHIVTDQDIGTIPECGHTFKLDPSIPGYPVTADSNRVVVTGDRVVIENGSGGNSAYTTTGMSNCSVI